ncbi:SRPBCC family protein [Panacibacter sp. DH6]|uniref:SRPBCC family protein n=1 Tax=Panacibacter microcysteis TaxID=2793269 RepID=A0A931GX94_9BACT|nr:SRPBCC family protein [Panacibacter microcysteis]MBG9377638.1 SRPBCC family protein [Panacibacter microcysteis]
MNTQQKQTITIETIVHAPLEKVWDYFTSPAHITQWNNASEDWHTPTASNDLKVGGSFSYRMEAKDGSFGFDFGGVYDAVEEHALIAYTLGDNRQVTVIFTADGNSTKVQESFEAETMHSVEMQQAGWQAILDNFKKYTEQH